MFLGSSTPSTPEENKAGICRLAHKVFYGSTLFIADQIQISQLQVHGFSV